MQATMKSQVPRTISNGVRRARTRAVRRTATAIVICIQAMYAPKARSEIPISQANFDSGSSR